MNMIFLEKNIWNSFEKLKSPEYFFSWFEKKYFSIFSRKKN